VKETRCLRSGDSYFAARESEKTVVVTLRIRNTGGLFQSSYLFITFVFINVYDFSKNL
jgi:hypothetical protein